MTRTFALCALVVCAAAANAETPPAPAPPAATASPDPAAIARGRDIFTQNCATCHGEAGAGGFGPRLRPIANRKDRRAVEEIIKQPTSPMPPLYPATLTDDDVNDVAAFLKSLH